MGRTFRKERDWDRPKYKRTDSKSRNNDDFEEDIDYAEDLYIEETSIRRKPTSENSKKHTGRGKRR